MTNPNIRADFAFPKAARLCSQKRIQAVFKHSKSFKYEAFRVIYLFENAPEFLSFPSQIVISVPKKIFKRANKRNTVRRKIKEAWRMQRNVLDNFLNLNNLKIEFIIVYTSHQIPEYQKVFEAITQIIFLLQEKMINK